MGNPGQYGTTSLVGFTNFQLSGSATTLSLNVNNGVLLVQSNVTTYNGTVVSGFTTFSAVGAIATKFETDNSNTTPYTFNGSATGTNTLQLDKSTFGLNGATLTMNSGGGGTYVHGAVTSTTFTTMNIIGGTDVTDAAAALAKKVTAHADGSAVVIAAGAVTYSAGGFSSTLSGFTTYLATIATSFETDNSIAGITFTGLSGAANTLRFNNSGFTSGTSTLSLTTTQGGTYVKTGSITTTTFTNIATITNNTTTTDTGLNYIVTLAKDLSTLLVTSGGVTYSDGTNVSTLVGFRTYSATGNISTTFETSNANATGYTFNGSTTSGAHNYLIFDASGLSGSLLTLSGTGAGTYVKTGPSTTTTFTGINTTITATADSSALSSTVQLTTTTSVDTFSIGSTVTYGTDTLAGFTTFSALIPGSTSANLSAALPLKTGPLSFVTIVVGSPDDPTFTPAGKPSSNHTTSAVCTGGGGCCVAGSV